MSGKSRHDKIGHSGGKAYAHGERLGPAAGDKAAVQVPPGVAAVWALPS